MLVCWHRPRLGPFDQFKESGGLAACDDARFSRTKACSAPRRACCLRGWRSSRGQNQVGRSSPALWSGSRAGSASNRDQQAGIHQNGKVGVLLEILCETDFVARTEDFKRLAHEVAMQIAAMNPKDVKALLAQDYIRDGAVTIEALIKQTIGKLGENIVVKQFTRFEI